MNKLTRKNATVISFVVILAIILCIVLTPQLTVYTTTSTHMKRESFGLSSVDPENITLCNGYYNVSVALSTGDTASLLQKFFVYPMPTSEVSITNKTIPDMTLYFNGTTVNPNQLNYELGSSSNLLVSCLIPSAEYASNTTMSLTVYTAQAMYCTGFLLP